jgi:hypothetical protein
LALALLCGYLFSTGNDQETRGHILELPSPPPPPSPRTDPHDIGKETQKEKQTEQQQIDPSYYHGGTYNPFEPSASLGPSGMQHDISQAILTEGEKEGKIFEEKLT